MIKQISISSKLQTSGGDSNYPLMFPGRESFDHPSIENVSATVMCEMKILNLDKQVKLGDKVAITAGSRGFSDYPLIFKTIVNHFKKIDAIPSIVTAMGSHGGATAQGQLEILRASGITPDSLGCDILSSVNTVPCRHN